MIKIISFKICPFVQRVTAILEAKNIPYDIEFISLKDKPEWFLDLSPIGQVPLLISESGEALFESDAIMEYIDEITTPLEPNLSPEQRAKDRAWSYQASKHYLVQCPAMRSNNKETLLERTQRLAKAFEKAEKKLTDGPFFKGSTLSNVDIAWLPLLHRAAIINEHTGYEFLDGFPKVKLWQQALMKTGIAEKSVANDFIESFSDFYMSDETYLGHLKSAIAPNASALCKTNTSCCN